MKILCNLPLECFEDRKHYPSNIELQTYGPPHRTWVDKMHYPADVEFDPAHGTIHELLGALPRGFRPDIVLHYWSDQDPIPKQLDECPVPVVGVMSDYNLTLPFITGLWPFFDVFLVDRPGVGLFQKLGFPDVRYFCQFTFKAQSHKLYPDIKRDLDVGFAGNLSTVVQRERAPWMDRVRRLNELGISAEVRSDIFGEDYGRFLNRARIGFNRSLRGEMNLRAFEVPACGGLLFMEEQNQEIRDFLTPGEEVVLYNNDNFEELVLEHLGDEPRRRRMAEAGHRRVQDYRMGKRLSALTELLAQPGPGRPVSTAAQRALGRGTALLATWACEDATLAPLMEAHKLAPEDPRPLNALATSLLSKTETPQATQAVRLLQKARALSSRYVPAAINLALLFEQDNQLELAERYRQEAITALESDPDWPDLDGVLLPLGFSQVCIDHATNLAAAVRAGDTAQLAAFLRPAETTPIHGSS
ncbi:MAG: glycosyltransferase [Planctomycetota bacterium]